MRALVQETTQNFVFPAGVGPEAPASVVLGQKDVRPRLEGYEGALRGPALSAQLADRAQLVFIIRPVAATGAAAVAAISNLQAFLSIRPMPLLGGDTDVAGNTQYAYMETDVSGQLLLFKGRLSITVQDWGVSTATLRILNWGAANLTALVTTQIYADVRVPQWEREREGLEEA
jgi:hypothetical protein